MMYCRSEFATMANHTLMQVGGSYRVGGKNLINSLSGMWLTTIHSLLALTMMYIQIYCMYQKAIGQDTFGGFGMVAVVTKKI